MLFQFIFNRFDVNCTDRILRHCSIVGKGKSLTLLFSGNQGFLQTHKTNNSIGPETSVGSHKPISVHSIGSLLPLLRFERFLAHGLITK